MNRSRVLTFVISIFATFMLSVQCYAVGLVDTAAQKGPVKPPLLAPKTKRHVTINEQKFELLSRQTDHWLLYDPQSGQYCITLNQLVVITKDLKSILHKVGLPYRAEEWQLLAADTYRWSGALQQLLRLRQKLKSMPDTRVEWQLQYLPLSKHAEI